MVRHILLSNGIFLNLLVSQVLYPGAYAQSSQTIALQHSTLLNTLPLASNSQSKVTASLKVGIVFHQKESGFAVRVDNLYSYVDVNRRVCVRLAALLSHLTLCSRFPQSITHFLPTLKTVPL